MSAVVEDGGYAELGPLLDRSVPIESGLPAVFWPGAVLAASWLTGTDLYAVRPSDAAAQLGKRQVPLLVIHGDDDALVPIAHGRRLAARYGVGVWTWFVPGAAHVGAYAANPSLYLRRVDGFLDGTLGTPV